MDADRLTRLGYAVALWAVPMCVYVLWCWTVRDVGRRYPALDRVARRSRRIPPRWPGLAAALGALALVTAAGAQDLAVQGAPAPGARAYAASLQVAALRVGAVLVLAHVLVAVLAARAARPQTGARAGS